MSKRISNKVVLAILDGNDQGVSIRQLARRYGVSPGSAWRIVHGCRMVVVPKNVPVSFEPVDTWRCPTCGSRINTSSCVRCLAVKSPTTNPTATRQAAGLGVGLHGACRRRYLAMKRYRDNSNNPGFTVLPPDHPLRSDHTLR